MSAISRSTTADTLRFQELTKRENEVAEKYKRELDSLKQSHSKELESVQLKATEKVNEFKNEMNDKLTENDRKHQQDIQSLREFYQRKLEDKARNEKG